MFVIIGMQGFSALGGPSLISGALAGAGALLGINSSSSSSGSDTSIKRQIRFRKNQYTIYTKKMILGKKN